MSTPYPDLSNEKIQLDAPMQSVGFEQPPAYTSTPSKTEIEEELQKVEEEIATLRAVLASRLERSAQLKRELGIYGMDVARDDIKKVAAAVTQSKPYTKTAEVVKTAANKTADVVTKQWNNVTQTQAYQTVNTKMSNLFNSVKSSISGPGGRAAAGGGAGGSYDSQLPSASNYTFIAQPPPLNPIPTAPPSTGSTSGSKPQYL